MSFYLRNPYAKAKFAGLWIMKMHRERYGILMSGDILYNYESEVRGPEFVTRKISINVSKIYHDSDKFIEFRKYKYN
ncbi:MAG: GDP-mannose 4,6-dehydratase [Candidatus Rehaiarchaeum fermentans]|nr:GDP-mannose 4,6-dehydratase [Candidatus Rehaiarchaeum fermentans]